MPSLKRNGGAKPKRNVTHENATLQPLVPRPLSRVLTPPPGNFYAKIGQLSHLRGHQRRGDHTARRNWCSVTNSRRRRLLILLKSVEKQKRLPCLKYSKRKHISFSAITHAFCDYAVPLPKIRYPRVSVTWQVTVWGWLWPMWIVIAQAPIFAFGESLYPKIWTGVSRCSLFPNDDLYMHVQWHYVALSSWVNLTFNLMNGSSIWWAQP